MVGMAAGGWGDGDGARSGGGSRGGSLGICGRVSEDGRKSLYCAGKREERPERIDLAMGIVVELSGAAARRPLSHR